MFIFAENITYIFSFFHSQQSARQYRVTIFRLRIECRKEEVDCNQSNRDCSVRLYETASCLSSWNVLEFVENVFEMRYRIQKFRILNILPGTLYTHRYSLR